MCSDQAIYQTRASVAQLLGLPPDRVRVQFYSGSNTFGSSCYVEAALAAALMSRELGKPVRVQLSREDELGWDNYAPAHLADVRGAVDQDGKLIAFEYQGWGHGSPGPTTVTQLALGAAPASVDPNGGGLFQLRLSQNDMYDIPNRRMVDHRVPGNPYLRIGALRAPLDPPYFFAQEGMMDELAHLAQLDPYEFRKKKHLPSALVGRSESRCGCRQMVTRSCGLQCVECEDLCRPRDRPGDPSCRNEPG